MEVFQNLHMDLARCGRAPVVSAVQGDANTRVLVVSLYDNGIPWEIPQGVRADMAYKKPDGTCGIYSKLPDGSAATTFSGNVLTAVLAPQVLTCPGHVTASFVFYKDEGKTLATFPVTITVTANPAADAERSEDYFNSVSAVFAGDENTTVAEFLEAFQSGKTCFMIRPLGSADLWSWMLVNANANLARFHTTDQDGNILCGTLSSDGTWAYETRVDAIYTLGEGETLADAPSWAQVVLDPDHESPELEMVATFEDGTTATYTILGEVVA